MTKKEKRKRIALLERNREENELNYKTGKISREQYHIRRKDVTGRLAEIRTGKE